MPVPIVVRNHLLSEKGVKQRRTKESDSVCDVAGQETSSSRLSLWIVTQLLRCDDDRPYLDFPRSSQFLIVAPLI
jgi:hypothetical protein